MNKIIEVNDQFSFAVVEPGVTWKDLIDYAEKHGKKVWVSTPSLSWGSVIGNVSVLLTRSLYSYIRHLAKLTVH